MLRLGRIVAALLVPLAIAGASTPWTILPTPTSSAPVHVLGVSCVSANWCMAVGSSTSSARGTYAMRWSGGSWASMKPPGVKDALLTLTSVSCRSTRFCMATGTAQSDAGTAAVAELWNGTSWTITSTPKVPGSAFSEVSCWSPTGCIAVGQRFFMSLAEEWNGSRWASIPVPSAKSGEDLMLISCPSARWCMAIAWITGQNFPTAESWNGVSWKPTSRPAGAAPLDAEVTCVSRTFCFLTNEATSHYALTAEWNGSKWTVESAPAPAKQGDELVGVSCSTTSFCVAVGRSDTSPLIEQWDGKKWSIEPIPNQVRYSLNDVSCVRTEVCMAVGTRGGSAQHPSVTQPFAARN